MPPGTRPTQQAPAPAPASTATADTATNAALGIAQGTPDQIVQQLYGYMAWALAIPEVADILHQAAADATTGAPWSDQKLQGALQATKWWQTTNAAARTFAQSWETDRATVQSQISQKALALQQQLAQDGVTLDPARLQQIATDSLRYGWTPQQENVALDSELQRSPDLLRSKVGEAYKQMSNDYAVTLSDPTIQAWAAHSVSGVQSDEQFREYLQGQALNLYKAPELQGALQRGVTVRQFYDHYAQIAASTLGVDPNQINLNDPKWQAAVNAVDAKGNHVTMSSDQWQDYLRQNPQYGWQHSQQANDAASSAVAGLASAWGF